MIPSAPLVRFAIRLLGVVPPTPVRWVARRVGTLAYFFAAGRRATLLHNRAALAPNESPAARRRGARRTFENLLEAAVELWRVPSMSREDFRALVDVDGRENLDAALALGRGVVAVTPHLGPYELGGAWLALEGYPVHAMVEILDPEVNAALSLYREATGMRLVSRNASLRVPLRILREQQILLLVADRVVGEGGDGIAVPFGAGVRNVPTGPAALALATGAPIIVGYITRSPDRVTRYLVRLEPPIVPSGSGDAHRDRESLTRQVADRLASAVQAHAEEWFVFQPEWIRRDVAP